MRLLWEPSTGFRPEMSSRRKTPKANTSVFSSTMPCVKYSGARHLSSSPRTEEVAWRTAHAIAIALRVSVFFAS
jgi:hypothetical protein